MLNSSGFSTMELVLPCPLRCELSCFAAMVTASYYYHTYAGSVSRTLPAASVHNIYRISMFCLTVLSQSLHANLLFLIFGPDLEVWPNCWNSAKFLRSPIHHLSKKSPQHHHFLLPRCRTSGLEAIMKSKNKELFVTLIWQENF